MQTIEFEWPLLKWGGKEKRDSFDRLTIFKDIKKKYGIEDGDIEDGDFIDGTLTFDRKSHAVCLRVTSGGSLLIKKELAEKIKSYANKNPGKSVSFKLKIAPKSKIASNLLKVTEEAETTLKDPPETTQKTLVDARVGQDQFRAALMKKYEKKCAVTGADIPELLRASHIKPWQKSTDEERLNVENGLLLIANFDAAFDAGLISFDDEGKMLFREDLYPNLRSSLGFQKDGKLANAKLVKSPSDTQKGFLHLHRTANGFK